MINWEDIAKLYLHPTQVFIIEHLGEHDLVSPSEIASLSNETLGTISYHCRVLSRKGVIKLNQTLPVRGAIEHFYRLNSWAKAADVPKAPADALSVPCPTCGAAAGHGCL